MPESVLISLPRNRWGGSAVFRHGGLAVPGLVSDEDERQQSDEICQSDCSKSALWHRAPDVHEQKTDETDRDNSRDRASRRGVDHRDETCGNNGQEQRPTVDDQ